MVTWLRSKKETVWFSDLMEWRLASKFEDLLQSYRLKICTIIIQIQFRFSGMQQRPNIRLQTYSCEVYSTMRSTKPIRHRHTLIYKYKIVTHKQSKKPQRYFKKLVLTEMCIQMRLIGCYEDCSILLLLDRQHHMLSNGYMFQVYHKHKPKLNPTIDIIDRSWTSVS